MKVSWWLGIGLLHQFLKLMDSTWRCFDTTLSTIYHFNFVCPRKFLPETAGWSFTDLISKAEKSVFQISFTLYLCFEKVEQDFFFRENKYKQTPFASIWRFFMDVPMNKERGVLCLSEWWRPWFEKSEVTGIRQLFYCALGSPQPIQKSSLQKTLRDLQNDQTEEKSCCVT